MNKTITIAHLYPREMNIYGDLGNVIAMKRRLEWRGIEVKVKNIEVGEPFDFAGVDIIFGGGGQDSGQTVIAEDLLQRGSILRELAAQGVPMLAICGTYQLFGRGFSTVDGREIPGIGIFNCHTTGTSERMIGNIVVESQFGQLVGFENHSGQTVLDDDQESLGSVLKGYGNNSSSHMEGAIQINAIGTYLHGPILPKNPVLTDALLSKALDRKYGSPDLKPLNDEIERAAAGVAIVRPQ